MSALDSLVDAHVFGARTATLAVCSCGRWSHSGRNSTASNREAHAEYRRHLAGVIQDSFSWVEGWVAAMDWLAEHKGFEGIALAEEMATRLPAGTRDTPPEVGAPTNGD